MGGSSKAGALIRNFRIITKRVDTSVSDIRMSMGYNQEVNFYSDIPITVPATLQLLAASQGGVLRWSFFIDAGVPLTLPDNWKMSDANFVDATHIWTPTDGGTYYWTVWYDNTNWNVTLSGPENVV